MRLFWLLWIIPLVTSGQHAVIRGVAPLAIGDEIQLRVYDDPISGKERILAKQKVEADGSFELKAIPNGVQYAFLQVGQDCADFFIEREKDLELTFVPPAKDPKRPEAFYERHFFAPRIMGGKSSKLNKQIIQFNDTIDAFLERVYPLLVNRRNPQMVAKQLAVFQASVAEDFLNVESFAKAYIKYSIAGVEQTFQTNREQLFNKYLNDQPVLFDNPAYVDFVRQFFQGSVNRILLIDHLEECKKALNQPEAFAAFDKMLAEDPMLENTALRRLVLLDGMEEMLGHKDLDDQKLLQALKTFGGLSSNSHLAYAARNVALKHEKLMAGNEAPEIVFRDLNGTEKKLSDFHGAYVFLELTDAKNGYCQRETNVIPNLKSEFKNIQFLTICVGNSQDEIRALRAQMLIDWELGGIELSAQTLDDYDVKSLPLFFIIDPNGKFYKAPAKDPTKGAQGELMSLSEMLKAKGRRSVGGK